MIKSMFALSLLACVLLMTPDIASASRPDLIAGKYHCEEVSQNEGVPSLTSDLFVSKMEKGQYKFHWDYSDGTHFEGISSPKKRPSSSFTIQYNAQAKPHLSDKQIGFETFEAQKQGQVLVGRFSTVDHKDAGEEICHRVKTN